MAKRQDSAWDAIAKIVVRLERIEAKLEALGASLGTPGVTDSAGRMVYDANSNTFIEKDQ